MNEKERIELARRIREASIEVGKLYASKEWRSTVLAARHRYMQQVELTIERGLKPNDKVLSQAFSI